MNDFDRTLKKYLDIFRNQELYFVNDIKNLELFEKTPLNIYQEDIRTKVSAINDAEVIKYAIQENVINHIFNLKIDDQLNNGDLSLVESLADFQANGQFFHLLHFASVYCNFHRPEIFPIYSDHYQEFYNHYLNEDYLPPDSKKNITYPVFSKSLNDLIDRLKLKGEMDYLHMRKFSWLYADIIVKESTLTPLAPCH